MEKVEIIKDICTKGDILHIVMFDNVIFEFNIIDLLRKRLPKKLEKVDFKIDGLKIEFLEHELNLEDLIKYEKSKSIHERLIQLLAEKNFIIENLLDDFAYNFGREKVKTYFKCEEDNYETMIKYYSDLWKKFYKDTHNEEHFGDCINVPTGCTKCLYEEYIIKSEKEVFSIT